MKAFQKYFVIISISFLLFTACQNEKGTITNFSTATLQKLQIETGNIPQDVNNIIGILYHSEYDTIIREFTLTANSAYCIFEDVPAGNWYIVVQAYNNTKLTYEGEAYLTINEGTISHVSIRMTKVNEVGTVSIDLDWSSPEYSEYVYDFNDDDDDFMGWGGRAEVTIINNQLVLYSGFIWHLVEYCLDQEHYTSGEIEYDVYTTGGRTQFQTKGDCYLDGSLGFGIIVSFENDSVFVAQYSNQKGKYVFTNYKYEINTWYTVKCKFDNYEGEKGKYELWISETLGNSPPVYLGKYDFQSEKGRLMGFNQFVLANSGTWEKTIYDNIRFKVK